ncbi:hypothetical protein R1flu_008570 [Riccia fluitans]|uniref:Uncharacterized protein n=1 Tax=Riccia fluitans TaxID=41844 RepID=A0ABD1YCA2_9MARC
MGTRKGDETFVFPSPFEEKKQRRADVEVSRHAKKEQRELRKEDFTPLTHGDGCKARRSDAMHMERSSV